MLSNLRRALTPTASHIDDKDLPGMSIDNSSTAPNFHLHGSSPPPFSPVHVSQQHSPGYAPHTTNGNGITLSEQHDQPIDLSSNHGSMDPEHEVTDDSLLGPVTADPHEDSHNKALSLDGASGDHLQPHLEDTHPQGSLLSTEPAQSTSKSQKARRTPTPSVINVESEPKSNGGPQPFNPVNKASPERTPHSQDLGYSTSMSARASAGPEQSVPAAAEDKMPFQSQDRPSKHSLDDSPSDLETKKAKKPRRQATKEEVSGATTEEQVAASDGMPKKRGRPKKEEGSTNIAKQQATTGDELPKKRGRPKKEEESTTTAKQQAATRDESSKKRGRPKKEEGSTTTVKQQAASRSELPKKRGRPKEDQGTAREAKSQRTSKEDTPAKRGRAKKEAAPTADHTEMKNVKATKGTAAPAHQEKGGKKNRKQLEEAIEGVGSAESAGIGQPANVPAADTTKKRGRPKKGEAATQGIETQAAPKADTPRKKGTLGNNQDIADPDSASSSKAEEIPKKRGRPKTIPQSETPKTSTPAKRGRPSKEQTTPKGAKPVGIVKKKSGRK